MEYTSSSSSSNPINRISYYWDYPNLLIIRPIIAIAFVLTLISLGWLLAWKLVLVHAPLVQEIFGLRKKTSNPKPPTSHRFSKFYSSLNSRIPNPQW
ncbi:hypothetical protein CFOL_v3_02846 [Cephalotus follicularis]|uniref:Uncharacterized protein n=1 Tax=Cephalotus follicularis TaxID=3775 RepID=A0A1Q3AUG5_CEPFO|nr:hypothetical protein CFOL_v3_02846 [Cephalotus follicularis]